jgi:hypothetical protein
MSDTHESEVSTPRQEYARRLEARRILEARLIQRHRLIVRMRSVVLGVIVLQILLTEKERAVVFCSLLVSPILLFASLIVWRNRLNRAIRRTAVAAEFYEGRLRCLTDSWAGRGEAGTAYVEDAHPCALDMDLFGPGCLFELLCTPCTRWGRDTLAAWLRRPATVEEIRARQAAVAELTGQLDLREELAVLAREMPEPNDVDVLAAHGESDAPPVPPWTRATAAALSLLCLATFVAGNCVGLGWIPFLAALVLERGFARAIRRRVRHGSVAAGWPRRGLHTLEALLKRLERIPFSCDRLRQLRTEWEKDGRRSSRCLAQIRRLLAWAPLVSLLLWGTPLLLAVEKWRRGRGQAVGRWLAALGEFEALCALAAHAYENPDDPFPEIVPEGACFDALGLGHPLLPRHLCVRNDVRLGVEERVLIVSGSNMSGKSTLLRAIGVNAVLASAGAPVRARRLRITPLVVGATLRVQDSLQAGRSRFYAEVLRIRQLLDLSKQRPPLLFLLDELFQGTNSHDRRVGAEAVIRILIDAGAIGLVTTHDIALTDIVDGLAPRAENVHFEDRFENGSMVFDYRLRSGAVRSSNGLALMRAVGIEV